MKQKDIYLADLNPTKGKEQGGKRPVVIISGDTMNDNLNLCIICAITSKIKHYPTCVFLKKNNTNKLECDSEIITFQTRTISKNRLVKKIGKISDNELNQIFSGLSKIYKY